MEEVDINNLEDITTPENNNNLYRNIALAIGGIMIVFFFLAVFFILNFSKDLPINNSSEINATNYEDGALEEEKYQNYLSIEADLNCKAMNGEEINMQDALEEYNLNFEEYEQLNLKYQDSEKFRNDLFKEIDKTCPISISE